MTPTLDTSDFSIFPPAVPLSFLTLSVTILLEKREIPLIVFHNDADICTVSLQFEVLSIKGNARSRNMLMRGNA